MEADDEDMLDDVLALVYKIKSGLIVFFVYNLFV